jgi:hypothetical protein
MLNLLLNLGKETVSVAALREGGHRLARLYRRVTPKTLSRDLNFLKQHDLIKVSGDQLQANIEIMTQFTPPFEILQEKRAQRPARRRRRLQRP